jgi:hypothetical protein
MSGWFIFGIAVTACSSSGGGSGSEAIGDERAPFGPPGPNHVNQYVRTAPDGTTRNSTSRYAGAIEVAAGTFDRLQFGDFQAAATTGVEAWIQQDGEVIEAAGGEGYTALIPVGPAGEPPVRVELAEPVTIDLDVPVGAVQTLDLDTAVAISGVTYTASLDATWQLAADDVSLDTPAGAFSGMRRYDFEGGVAVPDFGVVEPLPVSGQVWYSPDRSVVGGVVTLPVIGEVRWGLLGSFDSDVQGDLARVEKLGVVDGGTGFALSTLDRVGAADADKDRHAKMIVELRYVDEARARTSEQPAVAPNFATQIGYFPSSLVQSPISFFHPSEAGKGFTYWIGFVDQAAKNEAFNGIAYSVTVPASPDGGAIRVTARIVYRLWAP